MNEPAESRKDAARAGAESLFPYPKLYPEINYVTSRCFLSELKEGSEVK